MLRKIWASAPVDGLGLALPIDRDFAYLRRWGARRFWRRLPWFLRPLAMPAARLLWIAAWWARRADSQFESYRNDTLRTGGMAYECAVWRQFIDSKTEHPLPGPAAFQVLCRLGKARDHELLKDKVAAAEAFARAGLRVARTITVVPRGGRLDRATPGLLDSGPLFVKPRRGSGARGARALDPAKLDPEALAKAAREDDLLIQPFLRVTPALFDLATEGSPPIVRITVARRPDRKPFVHSAFLAIAARGENPRDFLRGHARAPIDLDSGAMTKGVWFADPSVRYSRLPWNQARIEGRVVPDWSACLDIARRAMKTVPGLALVNWEIVIEPEGPTILEGNTCGDWILTNLSAAAGLPNPPLAPLLREWAEK